MATLGTAYIDIVGNSERLEKDTDAALKKIASDGNKVMEAAGKLWGVSASDGLGVGFKTATSSLMGAASSVGAAVGPALGVALATAAAGAFAGAFAGAVAVASGGLIIGLGALLQRENPAVKKSAEKLSKTFTDVFTRASSGLATPLSKALDSISAAIVRLEPLFTRMFNAVGPLIQPLTDGLVRMVENILPGFISMLEKSGPIFAGLVAGMATLGTSIGNFFKKIGDNAPAIGEALKDVIGFFATLIDVAGDAIVWLVEFYTDIKTAWQEIKNFATAVRQFFVSLWNGVISTGRSIIQWFRDLPGNIIRAIGNLVTQLWQKGADLIRGFASGVVAQFKGIWDWFLNLGKNLARAVGDLGRTLWNAGVQLIKGLWDGMISKFREVRDWLANLALEITQVKGPLDYDKIILIPAGQAIMDGLLTGLKSRKGDLFGEINSINSALGTVGGGNLWGSGASSPGFSIGMPGSMSNNFNQNLNFYGPTDPSQVATAGKVMTRGVESMLAGMSVAQTTRSV